MIDQVKLQTSILQLYDGLRGTFFYNNIGFSVTHLVFLKYATDNCLGANTREEMQNYNSLQRIFAARDVSAGPECLEGILSILDEEYHLDGLMKTSINDYARELFGLDESWNRKNTSDKNFSRIMAILSSMDLVDDFKTFEKGKAIVKIIMNNIYAHGVTDRSNADLYSPAEINPIINKILNVKDGETFLDFASGVGLSTISVLNDIDANVIHFDISRTSLVVSAMLLIMNGNRHFTIYNKDGFSSGNVSEYIDVVGTPVLDYNGESVMADKIFVDPPLGIKYKDNALREFYFVAIQKALASLKPGGKAIVAVPASALFGTSSKAKMFKEYIGSNMYIDSVISLPITWAGTSVTINLLVLSKEPKEDIYFFNGLSEECRKSIEKDLKSRKPMRISEDGLDWLASTIATKTVVDGISSRISLEEIKNREYDILPTIYIKEKAPEGDATVEEIDIELRSMYSKLSEFINK